MLKRVKIKNVKSIVEVDVSLSPVTVIIGRSGTGKSNFVQGIRLFRDLLGHNNISELHQSLSEVRSAFAPQDHNVEFEATFDSPQGKGEYFYRLSFRLERNNSLQLWEEKLEFAGSVVFHQAKGNWVVNPGLPQSPNLGQQLLLPALSSIPRVLVAHLTLTRGIGCYDFPGDVFRQNAHQRSRSAGLGDNASNYLEVVDGIVSNLHDYESWAEINAALKKLDDSIDGISMQMPKRDGVFVTHNFGGKTMPFPLPVQSEGLRRFFAHLLSVYQNPPKQTLIFEEPEKGIYPWALSVLADIFRAAPDSGRGQVILTTHSPELLDQFGADSMRVATRVNGQTQIAPLERSQVEAIRQELIRPRELLTVTEPVAAGNSE